MFPREHRLHAQAADEPVEVHLHSRLVAVGVREHDARSVGVGLQDRTEGPVDLRVHQHDVLSRLDCGQRDLRGELDGAGDLDHGIDLLRLGDEQGIVRHRGAALADRLLELPRAVDVADVLCST